MKGKERIRVAPGRIRVPGGVFTAFGLAVVAALFLGGCGGGGEDQQGAAAGASLSGALDPNTIIYVSDEDPKHLDPIYTTDIYEGQCNALMYDNLVHFETGEKVKIRPGLAESWEISEDGKTYTLHLRKGVRFHDGSEFTAEDVKYTFERLFSPFNEPVSPRRSFFDLIDGAKEYMKLGDDRATGIHGITIVDPYTVEIRLEKPFVPFLGMLGMPNAAIVPASLGDNARSRQYLTENPNGTGPWILEDWKRGQYMRFRSNKDYWDGAPKAEGLVWKAATADISLAQDFEIGNVDFMYIPTALHATYLQNPKWTEMIHKIPELNTYYWAFQCQKPPYDDVRVRQAISYAVNADLILEAVNLGRGVRAHGPVPPALEGYREDLKPWPYDPEKALALLKETGHLRDDGSADFEVELWIPSDPLVPLIAEAVKADLAAVGIQSSILKRENTALKAAIRSGEAQMYFRSWWADYPDIENFLYPCFHSDNWEGSPTGGGGNGSHYSNPNVDQLIDEGRFIADDQKRIELFQQAVDRIREECPWIFLWHRYAFIATQPWIKGFVPSAIYNAEKFLDVYVDVDLKNRIRGGQ